MDRPASLGLLRQSICCSNCKRFQTRTVEPPCNHRICFDCIDSSITTSECKTRIRCNICQQESTLPPNYYRMRGYSVKPMEPRLHVYCSTTSETRRISPPRLSSVTNSGVTTRCSSCLKPCTLGSSVPECDCHSVTVFPYRVTAVVRGEPYQSHASAQPNMANHNDEQAFPLWNQPPGGAQNQSRETTIFQRPTVTNPHANGPNIPHSAYLQTSGSHQPYERLSDPSRTQLAPGNPPTRGTSPPTTGTQPTRSVPDPQTTPQDTSSPPPCGSSHTCEPHCCAHLRTELNALTLLLSRTQTAREEAETRLENEKTAAREREERQDRDRQEADRREQERKDRELRQTEAWNLEKQSVEESKKALDREVMELTSLKERLQKELSELSETLKQSKTDEKRLKERMGQLEQEYDTKQTQATENLKKRIHELELEYNERRRTADTDLQEYKQRHETILKNEQAARKDVMDKEEAEFHKRKETWLSDWKQIVEEAKNQEEKLEKQRAEQQQIFLKQQKSVQENWEREQQQWNKKKLEWIDEENQWVAKQKQNQRIDDEWTAMDKRRRELQELEEQKHQEQLKQEANLKKLLKSVQPVKMRCEKSSKNKLSTSDFGPIPLQQNSRIDPPVIGFSSEFLKPFHSYSGCGTSWVPRASCSTGFGETPASTKKGSKANNLIKQHQESDGPDSPSRQIPTQAIPLSFKVDRVSSLLGIGMGANTSSNPLQGFNNVASQLQQSKDSISSDQPQLPLQSNQGTSHPKSILRNSLPPGNTFQGQGQSASASRKYTPSPAELVQTLLSQNQSRPRERHGQLAGSISAPRNRPHRTQTPHSNTEKRPTGKQHSTFVTLEKGNKSLRTLTKEAEVEAEFFEQYNKPVRRTVGYTQMQQSQERMLRQELFGTSTAAGRTLEGSPSCCEQGNCSHAFLYTGPFLHKSNSALSTLHSAALHRELMKETRCADHS